MYKTELTAATRQTASSEILDSTMVATEKLTQIIRHNEIKSITVARMTVPCCGGLPFAVRNAVEQSGKDIPVNIVIISPSGEIVR